MKIPLIAFAVAVALGQTLPTPVGTTSTAAWDHSGLDVAGNPETLANFELAITPAGADLAVDPTASLARALAPASGGPTYEFPLDTLVAGAPAGPLLLWVRAIDAAGNYSAWGAPLPIILDSTAPVAPTKVQVKIQITIGG